MFCSLFTQSIYYVRLPQPVGKDKYTFVHLLKESPYPALDALPINPILLNAHILRSLFCYQFIQFILSDNLRLSLASENENLLAITINMKLS